MGGEGQGYAFGDLGKLFEQNGWMKAELEQKATKADLIQLKADLMEYSRELEDRRIEAMKTALTEWWSHEEPVLMNKVRSAIVEDRREQTIKRQEVLAEQGLELGPDGKAKSKVNPVIAFAKRQWTLVPVVMGMIALTKPEWFGYAWTFALRAFL